MGRTKAPLRIALFCLTVALLLSTPTWVTAAPMTSLKPYDPSKVPYGPVSPHSANWTSIASNATADPVVNLSHSIPSLPGGSWSTVSSLLSTGGGGTFVLGADNQSGLPKVGTFAASTFSDVTGNLLSAVPKSVSAAHISFQSFSGGMVPGNTKAVMVWNGGFSGLTSSPLVLEMNLSTGATQRLSAPAALTNFRGASASANFTLFVGSDAALFPELWAYLPTIGFVNATRYIPAAFSNPANLLATPGGVLLSTNSSGKTLGLLALVGGVWNFTDLSSYLPASSPFTSPVTLLSSQGNWVLFSASLNLTGAIVYGLLNVRTGVLLNVTSASTPLGEPTAVAPDSRTTTNFTLASPDGIVELDAATGLSSIATRTAWTNLTVPESLLWASGVLEVGGYRVQTGGFLGTWTGIGPLTYHALPSGFVDGSSTAVGSGDAWFGGTNGTGVEGILYNLTTHSVSPFLPSLPPGFDTLISSVINGGSLYLANLTTIVKVPLSGGPSLSLTPIPNGSLSVVAWVNGTLWAGGTDATGQGFLDSYDFGTASWNVLTGRLQSPLTKLTDIIPNSADSALIWGEATPGSGMAWYFNASSPALFLNLSVSLGPNIPVVEVGQAVWNGTAFWIYDGKGVEDYDPFTGVVNTPILIPPSPIYVTSLAVQGAGLLLGGFPGNSAINDTTPMVFVGDTGSLLTNLTPPLGSPWLGSPVTLAAGSGFLFACPNVNGTFSMFSTAPPVAATLYANASEAEIPFTFHFSLARTGGEAPYGIPHWSSPGETPINGTEANYTFTTTGYQGVHNITVTFQDAGGATLTVEGGVFTYSHVNISLSTSSVNGYAPLNVTFTWGTSGGAGTYGPVSVSYGDGQSGSNLAANGTLQHEYLNPGNFTAIFSVNDSFGYTARASVLISVVKHSTPPPPPPKNNTTKNTTNKTSPPGGGSSGIPGWEIGAIVAVAILAAAGIGLGLLYYLRQRQRIGKAPRGGSRRHSPPSSSGPKG